MKISVYLGSIQIEKVKERGGRKERQYLVSCH